MGKSNKILGDKQPQSCLLLISGLGKRSEPVSYYDDNIQPISETGFFLENSNGGDYTINRKDVDYEFIKNERGM